MAVPAAGCRLRRRSSPPCSPRGPRWRAEVSSRGKRSPARCSRSRRSTFPWRSRRSLFAAVVSERARARLEGLEADRRRSRGTSAPADDGGHGRQTTGSRRRRSSRTSVRGTGTSRTGDRPLVAPRCTAYYGIPSDEVDHLRSRDRARPPPDDRGRIQANIARALAEGGEPGARTSSTASCERTARRGSCSGRRVPNDPRTVTVNQDGRHGARRHGAKGARA